MKSTKEKGDIGLTMSIAELTKNGFNVSLPIAEHLKYDLIAEKKGTIARVQCRFTTAKNNMLRVKLATSWANSKGCHVTKRSQDDYDILAVYCPDTDRCYFLADQEFDAKSALQIDFKNQKTSEKTRLSSDFIDCNRAFDVWAVAKTNGCKKILEEKENLDDLLNKEKLLEFRKTMTNQQIGLLYGVSHVTVAKLLKKYNIENNVHVYSKRNEKYLLFRDKVMDLLRLKESPRCIAKKVGCSKYMVCRIIDEEEFKNNKLNNANNGTVAEGLKAAVC